MYRSIGKGGVFVLYWVLPGMSQWLNGSIIWNGKCYKMLSSFKSCAITFFEATPMHWCAVLSAQQPRPALDQRGYLWPPWAVMWWPWAAALRWPSWLIVPKAMLRCIKLIWKRFLKFFLAWIICGQLADYLYLLRQYILSSERSFVSWSHFFNINFKCAQLLSFKIPF